MSVQPLQDRIVIKRVKAEEKTAGGLFIPDTAKDKPMEGQVVAVGPGKVYEGGKRHAPDVKVGDKVLFAKYSGTDIKIDGEDHLILREEDVLAVVEGK